MNGSELLAFMRAQKWAVQASVAHQDRPQAAVIGVAVTDAFELVFDTLAGTRKAQNLRAKPNIALVIGWDDGRTLQYEGLADEPTGDELVRLKRIYLDRFADGAAREALPDIVYFRVKPTWMRLSDFRGDAPTTETWEGESLARMVAETG